MNNIDLTDVSGNILHSTQNNSQDQDHTEAKKWFKVRRGVAGLAHNWYILWDPQMKNYT